MGSVISDWEFLKVLGIGCAGSDRPTWMNTSPTQGDSNPWEKGWGWGRKGGDGGKRITGCSGWNCDLDVRSQAFKPRAHCTGLAA